MKAIYTTFRRLLVGGICLAFLVGSLSTGHAQVPGLSVSNVTIVAGKTFALPLDGNDPGGNPLTFSIVSNSMSSLTTRMVSTNRTLKLNVSVTSTSITTNSDFSYTTNTVSGTNSVTLVGGGYGALNTGYEWNRNGWGNQYWDVNGQKHIDWINESNAWVVMDSSSSTLPVYATTGPGSIYILTNSLASLSPSYDPVPSVTFGADTNVITTNSTYTTNTTAVSGDLMLELFEHLTPKTTARIISLVKSNFYNGLLFHRVIQNFMAQGGDPLGTGSGGSGVKQDDEQVNGLTFQGFGQLAMANAGFLLSGTLGRDNGDSQFFITAPNLVKGGANAPPEYLNYRHTIFGQLTHGFPLFSQLMATPVDGNSRPVDKVVINTASIITNKQAAVLYLTAPTNTGTATLIARAQSTGGSTQVTFQVNIVADTRHDPPIFAQMPDSLTTTQNVAVAFPFTWWGGSTNSIGLYDGSTGAWLMNSVGLIYDSGSGTLWLTPPSNFIGHVDLMFTVNDGYDHNGDGTSGAAGDIQEFDSETISLTVVQPNIPEAVNMPGVGWRTGDSTNGVATWFRTTATSHDGAALQSGHLGTVTGTNAVYSWAEITTNGPGSLVFWWKASTGTNAFLGLFINGTLVTSLTGVTGWQQYATYLSTTGSVRFTWAYTKSAGTSGGADAGWIDQVGWIPCPYAASVPQLFFQDNNGLIASWILNSTGAFLFARIPANTGSWALKAAGDIDGDGTSDLLFQNSAGDTGGWFMNADGTTRDARFWWNIGTWEIKACADYEGTGRGQVFFQTPNGQLAYWKLETNGTFQSAVQLGNQGAWKLRGAGDLDGDHKADLFFQSAAGQVAIWYHNPDSSIRAALAFSTGEWALSGVADVDHDGVCDLIWQTPDTRTGGWFMQTNSVARDARFWWPTGGWKLKAAGR